MVGDPPKPMTTKPLSSARSSRLRVEGCVLFVSEGNDRDRGQSLRLPCGTATVGTSAKCDLCLTDEWISRCHAEFSITKQGVGIRDLASTNGTLYLGNRIEKAVLRHGAQVRVGKTVLSILPLGESEANKPSAADSYVGLLGGSLAMRRLYTVLARLESSEAPVLIEGETGTGKELVTRAIHERGPRPTGAFVVLDCGAIAPDLVGSQLFGHVRGAFTGAVADHPGAFEQAHGGTIFLDEVGELPLDLQPRLLRVIEQRSIRRLGDEDLRPADARVVAATHRPLADMVKAGQFREDLYYRLAVVRIQVPPLRQRLEDLPVLAQYFAERLGHPLAPAVAEELVNAMAGHTWPGNVRELYNAVQRVVTLGQLNAEPITRGQVPQVGGTVDPMVPYKQARTELLDRFEAAYIKALLAQSHNNISQAARAAGIAREYLKELMRKHGIVK